MIPEAERLRDIHGLDAVPWWPLAPGWWFIVALAVLLWAWWHWPPVRRWTLPVIYFGSWRGDALQALRRLRQSVGRQPPKETVAQLSELLRRIAMARHGRAACAGLQGIAWLEWLRAHDPADFDWPAQGACLLAAPYAPPARVAVAPQQLLALIAAAERWVRA